MTTTQQGALALTVAPTQNTAPVFEFRCLYSHDLRKKKKTWHDGSLRFHTFNRRVMVYDDSNNYVGDLHYRAADGLQEGEELKLEKGVLVEVGERVGKTETDLAPLLEKRRPDVDAAEDGPVAPTRIQQSAQRAVATYHQGRPKSLAAVLGTSQGPIGRARVPAKSPYDQLHDVRPQQAPHYQPNKRQRCVTDKENAVNLPRLARSSHHVVHQEQLVATPGHSRVPLATRTEANTSKHVIDISSEEDTINSSPFSSSRGTVSRRHGPQRREPATLSTGPDIQDRNQQPKLPSKQRLKQTSCQPLKPASVAQHGTTSSGSRSIPLASARASSSRARHALASVTSSLRFAPPRPRKKLIYQELLSPSLTDGRLLPARCPRDLVGSNPRSPSHAPPSIGAHVEPGSIAVDPADDIFDIGELGIFETQRQSSHSAATRSRTDKMTMVSVSRRSSSPLFCSQPASQQVEIDTGVLSEGDFTILSQIKDSPAVLPLLQQQIADNTNAPIGSPQAGSAITELPEIPLTVPKLTLVDQQPITSPPPVQQLPPSPTPISPLPRTLRRVLSENDSPAQTKFTATEIAVSRVPAALEGIQRRQRVPETRVPFKAPTNLQRARSDTAAMVHSRVPAASKFNVPEGAQEAEDGDVGPWSSKEAYLLFDWWPPGHEKPKYACGG